MANYVRNLWYMAGWEEEIQGDAMLHRAFLDEPYLLYRRKDGGYAMLIDRCPHRLAPLHLGKRTGDEIACPYHGLRFNADGRCVFNPFSETIPPNARVTSLPVVARDGILWFWPGETEYADPATIPDFSILDEAPENVRETMSFRANYEIIADNLLDLSHAEFLHVDSFRMEGKIFAGNYQASSDGEDGAIWSRWWMENTSAAPHLGLGEGARLDEWLEMRWHAPASMLLHVGFTPAGLPREQSPLPCMANPHIITPETSSSSHYFYTREPGAESAAMADRVFEQEDHPMLEAVQRNAGDRDFWDWKPVILNVDAAAIRARRHLMKLRRMEKADERLVAIA